MPTLYAGAMWATRRWFKSNPLLTERITNLLEDIYHEFGIKARLGAPILGRIMLYLLLREEKRLPAINIIYEPPTFYETSVKAVSPPPILY